MRNILHIVCYLFLFNAFSQNTTIKIRGEVTENGKPLSNVSVLIKGSSIGTQTNRKGKFSVAASIGDTLIFSHLGMRTKEVIIENNSEFLKVDLFSKVINLDEITIKKKRSFSQKELLAAYSFNKRLIKTSRGIIDKDRASFSITIIDGENIIPVGSDFLYSLQNLYPRMRIVRDCPGESFCPKVYLQSWSSGAKPTAIFDVDGMIYEQPPLFIQANDIDRAAILVRNGAISRYGPAGAGGVIIINTKSQTSMDDMGVKRTYDNSILRDSIYTEIAEPESFTPRSPYFMKSYISAKSEKQAMRLFEKRKIDFKDRPYMALEIAEYFGRKWNNKQIAKTLFDGIRESFSSNPSVLKALAYKYEELGQIDLALEVYLQVLNIKSRDAQSHLDVATTYTEVGNYKKALSSFARYKLEIEELDSIPYSPYGTDLLMTTEYSNLYRAKTKELSIDKILIEETFDSPDTRLVFEWSNAEAEFELQIVDPEKLYYLWENTSEAMEFLRLKEKIKGYSSKQFFLDEELKGEWQININYLENISNQPTYLKVTTFFNYGSPSQIKATKVFYLEKQAMNMRLFTINNDMNTVSR